jgi:hypothetical protein
LPARFETNAIRVPSGDQRAEASTFSPAVRFRGGAEPSTGTTKIALR